MKFPPLARKVSTVELLTRKLKEENNESASGISCLQASYNLSKTYKLTIETADQFKERFLELIQSQITLLQLDEEDVTEDNMFNIFNQIYKKNIEL